VLITRSWTALGCLRDLDLALLIVARNEASELECHEKHGGGQQGRRRQERAN
jgi:hypothetical protein